MDVFIISSSCISAQHSFEKDDFLKEIVHKNDVMLSAIEPDYKSLIPSRNLRRMSRIIKMGVATSKQALSRAEKDIPDAIITGTGFGCMKDTVKFLNLMIKNREEMLNPTPFIQSTHNTIGAQIALLLKCRQYNFTWVHRAVSFESALIDSKMFLSENPGKTILAGGIDEIIPESLKILQRLGKIKNKAVNNLNLYSSNTRGSIAGEGAAFFAVGDKKAVNAMAKIKDVCTFSCYENNKEPVDKFVQAFFQRNDLSNGAVDLVLTGENGNIADKKMYEHITQNFFKKSMLARFKHLSGEYHTATAFATWLSANILKYQFIPDTINKESRNITAINNIVIYNHYQNREHSLILLEKP